MLAAVVLLLELQLIEQHMGSMLPRRKEIRGSDIPFLRGLTLPITFMSFMMAI
jgi:hypothetical protein